MSSLNKDILEKFERITNFPVRKFLYRFTDFIDNDYQNILNYYSGFTTVANQNSFNHLNILIEQVNFCLECVNIHKRYFQNFAYWDLLEQIEEIQNKLGNINNLPFYLRSYINKGQFKLGTETSVSLTKTGTLEKLEVSQFNSPNPNNDWYNLAIYNTLTEEEYGPNTDGVILKAFFQQSTSTFFLNSVLGNLKGILLYGIDLNSYLTFVDNDINIDSPQDTIDNAISRYLNMVKGDNPENNDGVQSAMIAGSSVNSLMFGSLFRQLTNVFNKDDTIFSFKVTNLTREANGIFMNFEIQTKLGEVLKENLLQINGN